MDVVKEPLQNLFKMNFDFDESIIPKGSILPGFNEHKASLFIQTQNGILKINDGHFLQRERVPFHLT
jgi:hypothetical protein